MILLDTCTLLWLVADQAQLSTRSRDALRRHRGRMFVSAISAFEIGVKHRKGKLELPLEPGSWFAAALRAHGLAELPITSAIAALSTSLPAHHSDPCDRLLIATGAFHGLTMLTPDLKIRAYKEVQTSW